MTCGAAKRGPEPGHKGNGDGTTLLRQPRKALRAFSALFRGRKTGLKPMFGFV